MSALRIHRLSRTAAALGAVLSIIAAAAVPGIYTGLHLLAHTLLWAGGGIAIATIDAREPHAIHARRERRA